MALLPVIKRESVGNELARFRANVFSKTWIGRTGKISTDQQLMLLTITKLIDFIEKEIVVKAETPGCKTNDVGIADRGNTLNISGEKKEEHQQKDKGYYHVERSYGSFRRDINLSAEIKADKIEASCKDGVLTLKLPKMESSKAVKVKVKGE